MMGKNWAQLLRLRNESSRRIEAELHNVASKLQSDPSNQALQTAWRELKANLIEYQHREQLDLQQCAHISWLTQGDRGTKFFARAIKARCWWQADSFIGRNETENDWVFYSPILNSAEDRLPPFPNLNILITNTPTAEANARLRAFPSGEEI